VASEEVSPAERVGRLREALRQYQPDCVFVASPTVGSRQMVAVMQAARQEGVVVRVYTHLSGILTSRVTVQPVGKRGVALTLKPVPFSRTQSAIKRAFDLLVAGLVSMLALPILAAVAIAIRVTSEGPVLFRQDRVTEGGRVFSMYKFRTMAAEADPRLKAPSIDTSVPFFKLKDDPRVTKLGKFLRKFSLDELPQLFNVIAGDMSLVGPRPLSAEQVMASPGLLAPRHEVRAGLTGWWQIHGRSNLSPEQAVELDLFYIENWSLTLDLYILLRTFGILVRRHGAY
jgi:exopolysaccharide biosynthesis polyprenyl glycosylphosphotransferase